MRTLAAAVAVLACLAFAPAALAHAGHGYANGTLLTWHGDTFGPAVSSGQGVDTGIAGIVPVSLRQPVAARLAGKRVSVQGARRGGVLVPAAGGATQTGGSVLAAVSGTRRVAVLLLNFTNTTAQPWTPAAVRNVVFDGSTSVAAYYGDASYGQFGFTGDVFGWYTIPDDNAGCDYVGWGSKARAAAAAAGVDLSPYSQIVYAFPSASSCGWAGLAYLPGRDSWINGAMTLRVVGHELGHSFGVHHASTLDCRSAGTRVPVGGTCSADEYGDPFTVMGSGSTYHHNNWHRAQLGWLPVQTVTTSGTYTLAPAELSNGTRLLRLARGDGTYLNLELRQPTQPFETFSGSSAVANGVSVRVAPDLTSIVQSRLLDATPGTASYVDSALAAGNSLVDPLTGVRISTVSVTPAGASVSIQFGAGGDTEAPGAPGGLTASAQGSSSVGLSWTVATDNVGVVSYRVYRGGTQVGTTSGLTFTDTGLSPGTTYAYQVQAVDAATNLGPAASATATTAPLVDTTAPTAFTLTAVRKGKNAGLSWTSSTDPQSGVASYRVFRNGTLVATTTNRAFSDKPGRGSFTYRVDAVNGVGLTTSSNTASVSL
jgi:hypothetical protein